MEQKQIEAFELYTELEEQGVEIKWIEEYYLFSKRQDIMEDVESYAREHEIVASADSVFLKALGAVPGGIYTLGSYLSGNAIDPNSIWFDSIRQAQIIRSTVSDEIAPENADHPRERSKLKELYQCGMGVTDLGFATALLQEYGLVLIGAEGYAEAGITGAERGLDGDTIQGEAIAATVCTIVLAALLKNTGGQSFGESFAAGGTAGGGSYGAGTITDVILAGDTGYIASEYKRYRAAGLSHERAQREVIKNELKRFHISVEEGAFMAGMANVAGKGIAKLGEIGRGKGEAFEGWASETEGGTSTLNDWVNRIPELSKQAPIEIPLSATVKVQAKNGYDQISFKWIENGQNYEVRWHTKTPGAPKGQGNTWVVSRVTPGTPTGQVRTEHILVGDTWIPRYQWQDAINAYRNGTATQEQLRLLKDGHWQAP